MRNNVIALAALAAVLTITGCTATQPTPDITIAPIVETPEPTSQNPDVALFGETWVYETGVEVAVNAPSPFAPGPSAYMSGDGEAIAFTATIVNNTDKPFTPSPYITVSSGGAEATPIFDVANGAGGDPSTAILPGGSVTWTTAWNVADPDDIVLQITPDSGNYNAMIYASST